MKSNGAFIFKKNKDGVDLRHLRKCRHFENILFELGTVDDSRLPIFILIRFWEIRKFLTNGLRESACIDLEHVLVNFCKNLPPNLFGYFAYVF
jgi:hypothetical protein